MITAKLALFAFLSLVALAYGYGPGDYVPKSIYFIDQFGHQSEPVSIRNRRDIMNYHPLYRVRRSGASASAGSFASAGASSGAGGNFGDYIPNFAHDPAGIIREIQNLLNSIPGAGAGAQSFASSSSGGNSGNGAAGPSSGQSFGGLGSGQDAGYQGPVLFSRFGEAEGSGVQVSGQAQGSKGAFASSSSSIDDKGKIRYSVQSGKY